MEIIGKTGPINDIDDQAAEWAVRAEYGDMAPESGAELEAWLAADVRHRGAFARTRAALFAMEDAVIGAHSPPALPVSASAAFASDNDNAIEPDALAPGPLRRSFFRWSGRAIAGGAALAASVAALVAIYVPVLAPFQQAERAATEVVTLKDGSIATLDRNTRIEVALSDSIRRITLLSGEATFKVAKDKARPFVVRSGDVYAQATGTLYSVGRVGITGGTVKVMEGSVLVWSHDERNQAVLLRAGGKLTLEPESRLPKPATSASPAMSPPDLAQISLDNVSIKLAVVRFNRINSTKIVIADPAIGHTEIIGLFAANDPEGFAQAAAAVSGGKVEHEQRTIVITPK